MQKDFSEPINDNPIARVFERNNALDIIDEVGLSLYPQIWGQCEFERKGFRYIGQYEDPEKPINIEYHIYQTPKYEDVLTCQTTAPLKYWIDWQNQFPEDFINIVKKYSPGEEIFPYKEITLFQQLTFKKAGLQRFTLLNTYVFQKFEKLSITKINNWPAFVSLSQI